MVVGCFVRLGFRGLGYCSPHFIVLRIDALEALANCLLSYGLLRGCILTNNLLCRLRWSFRELGLGGIDELCFELLLELLVALFLPLLEHEGLAATSFMFKFDRVRILFLLFPDRLDLGQPLLDLSTFHLFFEDFDISLGSNLVQSRQSPFFLLLGVCPILVLLVSLFNVFL